MVSPFLQNLSPTNRRKPLAFAILLQTGLTAI